jgi:hypothetical protein
MKENGKDTLWNHWSRLVAVCPKEERGLICAIQRGFD